MAAIVSTSAYFSATVISSFLTVAGPVTLYPLGTPTDISTTCQLFPYTLTSSGWGQSFNFAAGIAKTFIPVPPYTVTGSVNAAAGCGALAAPSTVYQAFLFNPSTQAETALAAPFSVNSATGEVSVSAAGTIGSYMINVYGFMPNN